MDQLMEMLRANNLLYDDVIDVNPVVERKIKNIYPESGSSAVFFDGDNIAINIYTGQEFIDPKQCYLFFSVQTTRKEGLDGDVNSYLIGSALNFFNSSVTLDKYSTEIDRMEQANLLNYHRVSWMNSDKKINALSGLMGSQDKLNGELSQVDQDINYFLIEDGEDSSKTIYYAVPLCMLSSVFYSDILMPPHLSNGMRLILTLERVTEALVTYDLELANYTISNVHIKLDTYRLAPNVFDKINEFYIKGGLKYSFNSWHHKRDNINADDTAAIRKFTVDYDRGVSKAVKCFVFRRREVFAESFVFDSFASQQAKTTEISIWNVGAIKYPDVPCNGILQHYHNLIYSIDMLKSTDFGIDRTEFDGDDSIFVDNVIPYGFFCYSINFERSNMFKGSGITINGNNPLVLEIETQVGPQERVDLFLEHVREVIIKDNTNEVLT